MMNAAEHIGQQSVGRVLPAQIVCVGALHEKGEQTAGKADDAA